MTTYFDEQFAGGSPGASLTNVNTGFDLISGTAPTFVADSPIPGAQSMLVNIGTAALSSGRGQLGASRSIIYINYPIKANAAWATGNWFPHEARATATIRADVRFPSGIPTMRNGTTAVWTSGVTLSTGVWMTCEHKIDNTAGKQSFTVWDASGAVVVASGDQTYSSGTMDNIAAGNTTSIASVNVSIGRVRVGDSSFGPIAFTSAPAENVALVFAAGDPTAGVGASAENVTATFAANDATVTTSSPANAPAELVTLTLAAQDPTTSIAANDGGAAFTLAAQDAAAAVGAQPGAAASSLAAADPVAAVAPNAGAAALAFAAQDPAAAVGAGPAEAAVTFAAAAPTANAGPGPAEAAATWSAADPAAAVTAGAEAVAATFAAQDATVSTATRTDVPAQVASWSLVTDAAAFSAQVNAEAATALFEALDAVIPAPVSCSTPRPSTGSTSRPTSGTTAYATATTARPGTGVTSRPDSGSTAEPC